MTIYLLEHRIDLSEAARKAGDMEWIPALVTDSEGIARGTAHDLVESKSGDWYDDWHMLTWPDGRQVRYRSYAIGTDNHFLAGFRIVPMELDQLIIGYAEGVWE